VDAELGIGLVELSQTRVAREFQIRNPSKPLAVALQRLQAISAEDKGRLEFARGGLIFDGTRIYLVKPALRGEWTRTEALNDAVKLSAHIAGARRQAKTG